MPTSNPSELPHNGRAAGAKPAPAKPSRRQFLRHGALGAAAWAGCARCGGPALPGQKRHEQALVAITLDLEMSRNFPTWETTHWDYEKGNLDAPTKEYAVEAGQRVREQGGRIHYFCVGRVLEQENVDWLARLAADGHKVGNHTYDHVYVLARKPEEIQYRFQRAPWLLRNRPPEDVIRENIEMTNEALAARLKIQAAGFRTPGGFANGLEGRQDVQRMLQEIGFRWVSSKYPAHANTRPLERPGPEIIADIVRAQAAAQPFAYPTGLVEIPMSPISDIGAFRGGRWPLEDFLKAIRAGVTWAIEHRAVYDFLAHPSCLVATDPMFRAIDLICTLVAQSGGAARLADLDEIAQTVGHAEPR